jgi:hypothetical protein
VVPRVAGSNPVIHPKGKSLEVIRGFFCLKHFVTVIDNPFRSIKFLKIIVSLEKQC